MIPRSSLTPTFVWPNLSLSACLFVSLCHLCVISLSLCYRNKHHVLCPDLSKTKIDKFQVTILVHIKCIYDTCASLHEANSDFEESLPVSLLIDHEPTVATEQPSSNAPRPSSNAHPFRTDEPQSEFDMPRAVAVAVDARIHEVCRSLSTQSQLWSEGSQLPLWVQTSLKLLHARLLSGELPH